MRRDKHLRRYTMQRRQLLKHALILGGTGALAGCTGGGNGDGGDGGDGSGGDGGDGGGGDGGGDGSGGTDTNEQLTLNLAGPPLSFPSEDPIASTFSEDYNVKTSLEPTTATPSDMISLFTGGGGQDQFDAVLDNGGGMEDLLASEGIISPIDREQVPNWDNMVADYRNADGDRGDTIRSNGDIYMVPTIRNADSLIHNKDEVSSIDSWGAIFDEQFAGSTAIVDDYARTPAYTALYLKENNMASIDVPHNMTPSEIETVIDFLIEKKQAGQFTTIWSSFQNVVSLHQNGEVVISDGYEPAAVVLRSQGVDVGYPPLKEGPFAFMNGWMLTQGGKDRGREAAYYRLAEYCMHPQYSADMLKTRNFLGSADPELVGEYIEENTDQYDVETLQSTIDEKVERYGTGEGTWNNVYPDHFNELVAGWDRFLNA